MADAETKPGLLWPTIFTLAGLAVLMGLGAWQMQRKAWKETLITSIAARATAEPVTLATALDQMLRTGEAEYMRVRVRGAFLHDHERYFYAPDPKRGPGYHVVTPFRLFDDAGVVLVNRGYVPDALKDPAKRSEGQVSGDVELTALVRDQGAKGSFTPVNDEKANIWYWRDIEGLRRSIADPAARPTVPVFLDAEEPAPGGYPAGGATLTALTNRHLEYAITWYGLAATLLAVYAAFVVSRRRRQ